MPSGIREARVPAIQKEIGRIEECPVQRKALCDPRWLQTTGDGVQRGEGAQVIQGGRSAGAPPDSVAAERVGQDGGMKQEPWNERQKRPDKPGECGRPGLPRASRHGQARHGQRQVDRHHDHRRDIAVDPDAEARCRDEQEPGSRRSQVLHQTDQPGQHEGHRIQKVKGEPTMDDVCRRHRQQHSRAPGPAI